MKETIILGGYDNQKRLTVICRARYHNAGAYSIEDMVNYGLFIMEQATIRAKEQGLDEKFVLIYDRRGMTSANRDSNLISFTMSFVKML